jgi:hypothetical protein
MTSSTKYIGMDVHKESISMAVRNSVGKVVMESVIETKASMILQFIDGLRGDLQVTFEEGTSAAWLYDLLKPQVTKLVGVRSAKKQVHERGQPERQDRRPPIGRAAAPQSSHPGLSRRTRPTNPEGVGTQLSDRDQRSGTGDVAGESHL